GRLETHEQHRSGREGNPGSRHCWSVQGAVRGELRRCRLRVALFPEQDPEDAQIGSGSGESALPGSGEGAWPMKKKRFANVWDAIEDTPAQAENMKLRSVLVMALRDHIARTELTQSEAAKMLGVTQPRISDLMRGKI